VRCALIAGCCLLAGFGPHRGALVTAEDAGGASRLADRALHGDTTDERQRALRSLTDHLAEQPDDATVCLGALRMVLRKRPPVERALALEAFSHAPWGVAEEPLLLHLDPAEETDERVWLAAQEGIARHAGAAAVGRALLRRAQSLLARPPARALVLEALGVVPGPAARLLLHRARGGESWVEAACRARALARGDADSDLDVLLDLLAHADLAVRVHAFESLQVRTRQPLPMEVAPWRLWLDAKRAGKPAPAVDKDEAAEGAGQPPDTRYAAPLPVHVPTYYDVPIPRPKSKAVFCLDVSQSMYGDGIKDARRHLGKALRDLPATHAFEIVAFNENLFPFAGRLVAAHPVQKWRAIQWLDTLETTSYTNIYDAVEAAFQHMGRGRKPVAQPVLLDMVFLLSDGAPNRGRFRHADRVVKHIGLLSRRDVPVHTIAAGERVFVLLQRIAEATGGVFTDAFE
jgi:hypothetical protein